MGVRHGRYVKMRLRCICDVRTPYVVHWDGIEPVACLSVAVAVAVKVSLYGIVLHGLYGLYNL